MTKRGRPSSVQLAAGYKVLSDGEWHSWMEVRRAMMNAIPIPVARRVGLRELEKHRRRKGVSHPRLLDSDDEALTQSGKKYLTRLAIKNLRLHCLMDDQDTLDRTKWRLKLTEEWLAGGPTEQQKAVRREAIQRAGITRKKSYRKQWQEISDQEASQLKNTLQVIAFFSRPRLWPQEPLPVFRTPYTTTTNSAQRIVYTGWLSYIGSDGEDEHWIIEQVWPYEEIIQISIFDIRDLIDTKRWKPLLVPKN